MKPRVRRLIRRLPVVAAGAGVLWLAGWFALPFCATLPPGIIDGARQSPLVLDRDGRLIHHLTLPDHTRSRPLAWEEIPPDLIAATLAAEDKRFFQHGGIDLLAIARAARDLAVERRIVSGASTITQQLVKISSPPAPRRPWTKVREALAARRLEMAHDKQTILTAYLNKLDYGNLRIGAHEAARAYFQKSPADLSLAECALLAGLPQAPSYHNPMRHPERAVARRNVVLHRLAGFPDADSRKIARALNEPLVLRPLPAEPAAPWLPTRAAIKPDETIRTTLSLPLQRDVEAIVKREIRNHHEANLRHAAVVIIHNPTGEIVALVSSGNWDDPRGGQINGTLAPRSPGSALKPFTFLLAFDRLNAHTGNILADIPTRFHTEQGVSLPENYDRTHRGPVTLRHALACSLNVPAMRLLEEIGGPKPLHQLLENLGITTLGDNPGFHGLGLTLGNAPVRLVELTNAYATLARHGRHLPCHWDPDRLAGAEESTPFDARHAYLTAHMLADARARAPAFPPGGALDLPFRCAIKTGTSSDFRDNWCLGFTAEFTVGVWAGNFEHQPMRGISGIDGAGPIFQKTMIRLHRDHPASWPPRPEGITEITIDPRTGKQSGDTPLHHTQPSRELALTGHLPPPASAGDYDAAGRACLDATYAEWFATPHNRRRHQLALATASESPTPLRITHPADHTTFLLDPDMPSASNRLRPVTNLPGTTLWSSPTLTITPGDPEPTIHLTPGTHQLIATDRRSGIAITRTIHVRNL
ncbi:MAG: penicillin-binding protein 1C [Luteolibacter sp.]